MPDTSSTVLEGFSRHASLTGVAPAAPPACLQGRVRAHWGSVAVEERPLEALAAGGAGARPLRGALQASCGRCKAAAAAGRGLPQLPPASSLLRHLSGPFSVAFTARRRLLTREQRDREQHGQGPSAAGHRAACLRSLAGGGVVCSGARASQSAWSDRGSRLAGGTGPWVTTRCPGAAQALPTALPGLICAPCTPHMPSCKAAGRWVGRHATAVGRRRQSRCRQRRRLLALPTAGRASLWQAWRPEEAQPGRPNLPGFSKRQARGRRRRARCARRRTLARPAAGQSSHPSVQEKPHACLPQIVETAYRAQGWRTRRSSAAGGAPQEAQAQKRAFSERSEAQEERVHGTRPEEATTAFARRNPLPLALVRRCRCRRRPPPCTPPHNLPPGSTFTGRLSFRRHG